MKTTLVTTLLCATLLTMPVGASPLKVGDVTYESTMTVAQQPLKLIGAGMRTKVFFKVYAAGLYLSAPAKDLEAIRALPTPLRVRLVMERDVGAKTFVDALVEGLAANTSEATRRAIQKEIDALVRCMNTIGDVKTGDVIDFDFTTADQTAVYVNGNVKGKALGGRELYQAVLGIWLGPKAIDSGLKRALLGEK